MTSFHPRGLPTAQARKFKSKRPRSNSDSFQEEDLRQSFLWVSEQLMLIKNSKCTCLGSWAVTPGASAELASQMHSLNDFYFPWGLKKKSMLKKNVFSLPHPSPLPFILKQRKSLPFGAASSYLNLEKLGEGSYATVYKGISR